jgi:hypothetical protein
VNWCDYCETCGECRDEGKNPGGLTAAATIRQLTEERDEARAALVEAGQELCRRLTVEEQGALQAEVKSLRDELERRARSVVDEIEIAKKWVKR